MGDPLSEAEKQRRTAVRDRELRRFLVTLFIGAIVYVAINAAFPATDRGLPYAVALAIGLVLTLVLARAIELRLLRRGLPRDDRETDQRR